MTKVREKFAAFFLMAMIVLPESAHAQMADQLKKQIKQLGFQSLYPMSTDAAPGVLYVEQKDAAGNRTNTVLCDDLFPGAKPSSIAALPSITANGTGEAKASLNLLPALFKSTANADADLAASGVNKTTLSFRQPHLSRIQSLVSATGQVRTISKACTAAISPFFDDRGNALQDIYLIAKTLNVGGVTYDVTVSSDKSAGIKAALTNLIGLAFNFKKTSATTATLTFDAPTGQHLVIGINAVRIRKLKALTMVANVQKANLAGEPIEPLEEPIALNLTK
jgi:hypothetical protein